MPFLDWVNKNQAVAESIESDPIDFEEFKYEWCGALWRFLLHR